MNEIITTGKTKEEAIQKALEKLGTTRDKVEVIPLAEPKGGILSMLGLARAKVKVRLRGSSAGAAGTAGFAGKSNIGGTDDLGRAEQLLATIVEQIGIKAEIVSQKVEDEIYLDIKTEKDGGVLIGRRGQTLLALGFLLERMISEPEGDRQRITVDVNGYSREREEKLVDRAKSMAADALEKKRSFKTEPLAPRERLVVHRLFENDDKIDTFSVGTGSHRPVVIAPKGMRGQDSRGDRDDRDNRDRRDSRRSGGPRFGNGRRRGYRDRDRDRNRDLERRD